jgi:hypothetical protein
MNNEETIEIEYYEGMSMEELVNAVNSNNDAILMGFGALLKKHSDDALTLIRSEFSAMRNELVTKKEFNERFDKLEQLIKNTKI